MEEKWTLNQTLAIADPATYEYFDLLLNHRTILINQEVDADFTEMVVIPLMKFQKDESDEPVTIMMTTVGGSVLDALYACDVIDNYTKPLNLVVMGYAMSMGAILLCAGAKNPNVHKSCYKNSTALIHAGDFSCGGERLTVKDISNFYDKIEERIREYVCTNTKLTTDEYDKSERKQMYLFAEDLLRLGFVDEIIGMSQEEMQKIKEQGAK